MPTMLPRKPEQTSEISGGLTVPTCGPEEASELVREHKGLAFLSRAAAWRISRDGLTMRPLTEERRRLVTSLAVRVDSKSRLVNKFVKAAGKKFGSVGQRTQGRLPLTG